MTAPAVAARSQARTTAVDVTSHAITLPTGIVAGNLLVVVFSSDGAPTVTAPAAWTKVGQLSDATNAVTGAVFWKVATGSDTLTLTTSVAEQSSHIAFRITGGASVWGISSSGSSTNSAPTELALYGQVDHLWICTRSGDSTVVPSAAPAGMTPLTNQAAVGTLSASTSTAEATSLDSTTYTPGTFTSVTEQWVSWTLQIHPANVKSSAITESFTTFDSNVWVPFDANSAWAGGQLVQTVPAGAAGNAALLYSTRLDLTGSSAFIEVVDPGPQTATTTAHIRPLYFFTADLAAGLSFYIYRGDAYVYHDALGVVAGPFAYNHTTMRWLKFRVTGANYYFETAPDGSTWTVMHTGTVASVPNIVMTDVLLVFQAVADGAEASASVSKYDNLNLAPVTGATGRPKVWNGSAHVQKPGKVWNGSAWVEKPWKAWTGTEWKKLT